MDVQRARVSAAVITGIVIFAAITLADGASHPCKRPCVVGQQPMTCEYNFTVEWYRTLSKACWDCPFNLTDCFRPQCVSGDGHPRPIATFNRQIPGPALEVCEGDTIVVWVTNEMEDGSTTSVHWHGMHQRGTPYFDGPVHITQCPIPPLETFKYEFKATPAGTHWYHSHSGMQYGEGAYGALIVRQPETADPQSALYDHDLSEHVMFIADWMQVTSFERYTSLMHDAYIVPEMSALVNGRGRKHAVPNTYNTSGSPLASAHTPLAQFHVKQGDRYRFRLVGSIQKCTFRMFVENHTMQIIATDGRPVSPVTVNNFVLAAGERYDVVILADQPVGNYWIRGLGLRDCLNKGNALAILHYEGAREADQSVDPGPYQYNGTMFGPLKDRANRPQYSSNGYPTVSLMQLNSTEPVNLTGQPPDVTHYVGMTFLNNDNSKFNNRDLYNVKDLPGYKFHLTPVMNNITFRMPPVPLLSQPEDVQEEWFCNRSTIDHSRCQDDLCKCIHRIKVKTGQMVEILLVGMDQEGDGHPMHLHGYYFHVLGMAEYPEPYTIEHVQEMDRQGLLPRKLINPPIKDTIMVPSYHYAIIRFRADNPGIWTFHCHIESHLMQGKALILQDGEYSEFPPLPDMFPRCGGYGTTNADRRRKTEKPQECKSNTGGSSVNSLALVTIISGLLSQRLMRCS